MAKPQPLDERIFAIRAEVNEFIEAKVQELRKQYQLPEGWLRADLLKGRCECAVFLDLKAQADAAKADAA